MCWGQLRRLTPRSFLGGHLEEVLFVNLEQTPAFLQRQVRSPTALVELNGWLVGLCHDEMHATAAGLHRSLGSETGSQGEHSENVLSCGKLGPMLERCLKIGNSSGYLHD